MGFLDIDRVRKTFGPVEVLKSIDISIHKGEFLVLVGPSGCGKSTLLNLIAGLEPISEGEIRIDGQRVNERHPKDRDIAMVFQSYALYPNMNVAQNMAFGLEMRGVAKDARDKAVAGVAKLLQIENLLDRKPGQLSGGQRQRVAMGRALVRDPKIFLFDEPLSNLDAKLRVEMRVEIKKLHQRLGATIVYVTHDQIEAMTMATRIAIMWQGELQQLGSPRDLYDTPANTFVATFIGSPSMNLLPAVLEGANGSLAARVGDLALPVHASSKGLASAAGRKVLLGLRPEAISDPRDADAHTAHHHEVELKVEITEPTGPDTLAVLRMGGHEATARLRADTPVSVGGTGHFMVDMAKASFFDPDSGNGWAEAMDLTIDTPTISPGAAMALVQAAIAKAHEMGWQVAACVTDRAGVPVALWRSPRVTQPPVGFAIDKAYTAASLGTSTQAFAERAQSKPPLAMGLANRDRLLVFPGGLPIRVNGVVVGGIGVSGAADHEDVICAEAALRTLGLEP